MVRTLARTAGALVFVCAIASILVIGLNAKALGSLALPPEPWMFWTAIVLAATQLVCILLIWRVFLAARKRFALRLQAVTGGMDDRIFLADAQGMPVSVLTDSGWATEPVNEWLGTVHPEDREFLHPGTSSAPRRIELRLKAQDETWRWYRLRAMPVPDKSGEIREWLGTLHDIHEQKLASEQRDLVIGELRHRLKNLVTVIDALAKNSRRRATDAEPGVENFLQRFLGRLHALGTAGDLFLAGGKGAIEAGELITATLAPFVGEATPQRIQIEGPKLYLSEELGAGIGLAIHELATNALKYGALSVREGSVSLGWSATPKDEREEIAFVWKERGGPRPTPPARPGFGSRMIKSVVAREKSGGVELEYQPDGVFCRIAFARERENPVLTR